MNVHQTRSTFPASSSSIPKRIKIGRTWILFAHKGAIANSDGTAGPGIFYAFRPQRIEKLIWASDATPEVVDELVKAGVTPVIIPDGDADHDPEKHDEEHDDRFDSLRRIIQHSNEGDEDEEVIDDPDGDLPAEDEDE